MKVLRRAAVSLLGGLVAVLGLTACETGDAPPDDAPTSSASPDAEAVSFEPGDCDRLDAAAVAAALGIDGDGFGSTSADRLSTGPVLSCAATWRDEDDARAYADLTSTVQRFTEQDDAERAWADAELLARRGGEGLGVPDDAVVSVLEPEGAWDDALLVTSARTLSRPRYGDDDLQVEVVAARMWVRSGLAVSQVTIVQQVVPEDAPSREDLVAGVQDAAAALLTRSTERL